MSPRAPEVLVVGGGPAGSTAATLLARRGHDVVLLDRARFPRPKPCGECLDPGAVALLGRLGLLESVEALAPVPLQGWRLRSGGVDVSARFGASLHGLGVERNRLDATLLEVTRSEGVRIVEGEHVVSVTPASHEDQRPRVAVRTGGSGVAEWRPRMVVGADGLRSVVVRTLGLLGRGPRLRKASVTAHVAGEGLPLEGGLLDVRDGVTLGVAPVAPSRWNATVVVRGRDAPALRGEPGAFVLGVLRRRFPDARLELSDGPFASGPFDWPVRRAWAPGAVVVGDAAGYFDPFTGQGIYRALRTAELAAEAVAETLAGNGWRALERYHGRWSREVRWSRRVQRAVEAVMSRKPLRETVLRRLDVSGGLSDVIRVTGDVAPAATLLRPRIWLGAGAAGHR